MNLIAGKVALDRIQGFMEASATPAVIATVAKPVAPLPWLCLFGGWVFLHNGSFQL